MRKEALLYLHDECNYSCSYCMLGNPNYRKRESLASTMQGTLKIIDFFNKRKEWTVLLSGGEPSEHPYFIELIEGLIKENNVRIDTNNSMSGDKLEEFIKRIDPERVEFIQCSLHEIDEEEERLKEYVKRVKILIENGFKAFVTYVATPQRVNRIAELYELFYSNEIPFVVVPFRSPEYPKGYSKSERDILNKYMCSAVHRAYLEIDERNVLGKACNSGHTRFNISGIDGKIKRCWRNSEVMGNIYEDTLNLENESNTCKLEACTYVYEPHREIEEIIKRDLQNIISLRRNYDEEILLDLVKLSK